jgi:hypothetical protein
MDAMVVGEGGGAGGKQSLQSDRNKKDLQRRLKHDEIMLEASIFYST